MNYFKGVLVILLVISLAGCPKPTVEVSLTVDAATLEVGQSTTVAASSTDSGDTDFTWSIDNEAVAAIGAAKGTSVTITALATGTATLTAKGSKSGAMATAVITVPTVAPVEEVTVVTVAPMSAVLDPGRMITLSAMSTDTADADYNWSVDGTAVVALGATMGTSVEVTTLTAGTAWITATGATSGMAGKAVVSVLEPVVEGEPEPVVAVSVTPVSAALSAGSMVALSAVSTDAADTDFAWSVADDSIVSLSAAAGATVDATALLEGITTVTVTGSSSGVSATATVSVLAQGSDVGDLLVPDGFEMTVLGVVIPEDLMAEVTFAAVNDRGDVIPLVEFSRFSPILAYLDPAPAAGSSARYVSYTTRFDSDGTTVQATTDGAGTDGISYNGDGTYTYKFKTAVPAAYNPAASHMFSGQMQRTSALSGITYTVNPLYAFRPDGSEEVAVRNIVDTDTCNKCHTRLEFHGGSRREIGYCILCHNPGTTDGQSGNTVDMPDMIHKIHRGANLPSVLAGVPYQIVGHRDTVHDYSEVEFPQDIRNCTVCHESDKAAQADVWMTAPTMAGCASCHDRTWFGAAAAPDGYDAHPTPQDNDAQCALCHNEANIVEAHTTWEEDEDNTGLNLEITAINADPGTGLLVVDIHATYGDGSPITDLATLATLSVNALVGWPSWEYEQYVSENVKTGGVLDTADAANGNYVYTFTATLPLDPGLSFGIAMTGRNRIDAGTVCISDDSITYFTIDGSEPVERRMTADEEQCKACHNVIKGHGDQRIGLTTCVICHNTTKTDVGRRPVDALPEVTVNFKDMIHKIHAGADLENGYSVYGFGNTEHDYSNVEFPGKLNVCSMCHGENSVDLPVAEETLPTIAAGVTTLPEAAACNSCHDGLAARVHGMLGGDPASGAESCATCHGSGAEVAVEDVHAMTP